MTEKLMSRELRSARELLPAMSGPSNIMVHHEVPNEAKAPKSKADEPHLQHPQVSLNSTHADKVSNQHLMNELPLGKVSSIEELAHVVSTQNEETTTSEETDSDEAEDLNSKVRSTHSMQQNISFNSGADDSPCDQLVTGKLMFKEQSSVIKSFPVIHSTKEFCKNTTVAHADPQEEEVLEMKANDFPIKIQKVLLNSKSADSKDSQPVMEKLVSRVLGSIEDVIIIDEDVIINEEDVIIIDPEPIHIEKGNMTETISKHKEARKSKACSLSTQCQQVALNGRAAASVCQQTKENQAFEDVIRISQLLSAIPTTMAIQGNYTKELEAFHEENVLETNAGDALNQYQLAQLESEAHKRINNKPWMEKKMASGDLAMNLELSSVMSLPIKLKGSTSADHAEPHEAKVLKLEDPHSTHAKGQKGPLYSETSKSISYKLVMGKLASGDLSDNKDQFPVDFLSSDNYRNNKVDLSESHVKKKKALKSKAEEHRRKGKQTRLNSRAASSICNRPIKGMMKSRELGCPVEMFSLRQPSMGSFKRTSPKDSAPTEQEVLKLNDILPSQPQKHTLNPTHIQSRDPGKANKKVSGVPFFENSDGADPSVPKAGSDTSASQKQKHSKNSKDPKVNKALHKKQKEMAPASQQAPANLPSNIVFTLESDQNTDCQIVAVYEAPSIVSSHGISSATRHTQNARKRQAVKEANIPSSMCGMHKSLAKRAYKPPALESECTEVHPLSSPEIVENINEKYKKRKNKWDEDIEITTVSQKIGTPSSTTNRLPTLCKKHFLDANNESITCKKPNVVSTETISAINEFMKQRRLEHPFVLCKCNVPAPSVKDPIINYFASLKLPKPSLSKSFTAASHEKQVGTGYPAENKEPTIDFAGQGLVCRRMTQDIFPCSHFPKTVHGQSNHQLPSTFRTTSQDSSCQTIFTQSPFEKEAPSVAFPGQGATCGKMAQASMPAAFPDKASSIKSSSSDSQSRDPVW